MFFANLSRQLYRFYNCRLRPMTIRSALLDLCPTASQMDRIEKILNADKDIEKKIMALRCEVSDVEAKILDNFLIERLERENRELEEEIQKYRNELNQLETSNGRQLSSCAHSAHLLPTSQVKSNETEKPHEEPLIEKKDDSQAAPAKKGKKEKNSEKKDDKKTENVEPKKQSTDLPINVGRLDLKVGKIVRIEKHPDADTLYVEKIDIGKPEPITVVSGLVKHVPINEMLDSLVIILCNLKPAKMRGVTSEGMVMCASADGVVEVLRPPPGSAPGDVITCPGFLANPDSVLNPKKKIFETVAPDLKTNDNLVATYKGIPWNVGDGGFVKAKSLKGANIK